MYPGLHLLLNLPILDPRCGCRRGQRRMALCLLGETKRGLRRSEVVFLSMSICTAGWITGRPFWFPVCFHDRGCPIWDPYFSAAACHSFFRESGRDPHFLFDGTRLRLNRLRSPHGIGRRIATVPLGVKPSSTGGFSLHPGCSDCLAK